MGIITSRPYTSAPNIMDTPDYKTKVVKLDFNGTDCIKAGSPISADGKVANDATAIGILLNDCHACLGNRRGLVVIDGRIKLDVAAAHSGITISDKAKAALVNISFTGDGERMGGGSSSGGVEVTIWDNEVDAGYTYNFITPINLNNGKVKGVLFVIGSFMEYLDFAPDIYGEALEATRKDGTRVFLSPPDEEFGLPVSEWSCVRAFSIDEIPDGTLVTVKVLSYDAFQPVIIYEDYIYRNGTRFHCNMSYEDARKSLEKGCSAVHVCRAGPYANNLEPEYYHPIEYAYFGNGYMDMRFNGKLFTFNSDGISGEGSEPS